MSHHLHHQLARRTRKGWSALLTVVAAAAVAATLAGPAPSASALVRSDQAGGPGDAYFADAGWNPTPVLQAKRDGGNVALSTGGMIVTPDPSAVAGRQSAKVTYYLYKRDADGVFRSYRSTAVWVPLTYQGRTVSQAFAGSGTIATVERGHLDAYQIRVDVSWYVGDQWQSTVQLRPTESGELACNTVSGCSVFAPGNGRPASLGLA